MMVCFVCHRGGPRLLVQATKLVTGREVPLCRECRVDTFKLNAAESKALQVLNAEGDGE